MDIRHLIVFENDSIIAMNKPHGLLVHRTSIAKSETDFALQWVRDYAGMKVYLAHRLDRKTSGVLLFAKSEEENSYIQSLFREQKIKKTYKAIVRGYTDDSGVIDYPITNLKLKTQDAVTHYNTIRRYEIPLANYRYPTSRYSEIELRPETGRYHQLRKHMAHIRHPILGDRPHGCNKHNRLWKETYNMTTMMLHAEKLQMDHDEYGKLTITAPNSPAYTSVLKLLNGERVH
jgi:tRNA pseudouridine65 synthase